METFLRAGNMLQNLIESCRKACADIGIEGCEKNRVIELTKCIEDIHSFIIDKQESSARGAARTAVALVHAHFPEVDLELCTAGVPPNCDASVVMAEVRGLDNRVVRMVDHNAFYDEEELTPDLQAKESERSRLSEVHLKTDMDSSATGYEESSDESYSIPNFGTHSKDAPQGS